MKFLSDQDIWASTISLLRELEHDVTTAAALGMSRSLDTDLLAWAYTNNRIIITRDRDYGRLVFLDKEVGGVIYLRTLLTEIAKTHKELTRVLNLYSESDLLSAFVVVEPDKHRYRYLPANK